MIAPNVGVSHKCSGLENKPSPWHLGFERPKLREPGWARAPALFTSPPQKIADVPQLDRPVPGSGGEELAIGAERHEKDIPSVASEGAHFFSCGHIPQLDLTSNAIDDVVALAAGAGGQEPPVGTERHGSDPAGVAFERADHLPTARVNELHAAATLCSYGQVSSIR